jgi:signal transduction histidine kinase
MGRRDSIEAGIVRGGEQIEAYRAAIPRFDAIRDSMLFQLTGFRTELMRAAGSRTADEARWAGVQQVLSLVLGAVALLAALLVGWFAWRQRELRRDVQETLEEVDRQRALAERRGNELERATEARARLMRGVTHDVKNPLGAARGYAELLQIGVKAPMLPEQAPLVEGVVRSIDGALAIIGDLLDLARADSDGLGVNRAQIDLVSVVAGVVDAHRAAAEAAGHAVEVHAPDRELTIFTDPARVEQVLGNLLSNAIKYTPSPGRITVHAALADGAAAMAERAWATVHVRDTGPGIPAEQREAIFEEFTRLDDGGVQPGHGLGLSIARRIARLLGGDLTVEGAERGGANFILWLPLRTKPDQLPEPGAAS